MIEQANHPLMGTGKVEKLGAISNATGNLIFTQISITQPIPGLKLLGLRHPNGMVNAVQPIERFIHRLDEIFCLQDKIERDHFIQRSRTAIEPAIINFTKQN